jgi:two-component system, OmpR family, response regulator PrrA
LSLLLVVDDDASTLDTLSRMLRLEGYTVVTARDSDAALHAIDSSPPDAILLDLHMPLRDGLVFLRTLRGLEQTRDLPAAVITGDYFVADTITEELRELHAELCFKPIWLADLLAVVERLLHRTA